MAPIVVHHDRKAHPPQVPADASAPRSNSNQPAAPALPPSPDTRGVAYPDDDEERASRTAASRASLSAPSISSRGSAAQSALPRTLDESVALTGGASALSTLPPLAALPLLPSLTMLPSLYDKRGRLILPAPLRGSHEILLHQNLMADSDGLERVQDDLALEQMRASGALVPIPASAGLRADERLPLNRRLCRPWAAQFLTALAKAHYARFHTPLQVNSAVRTVEFQQRLLLRNGNAAPATGDSASPHLTGQAIDLAKRGLSLSEIAWMRAYLLPLVREGKIDVEEEFSQSCFHISVYRQFLATPRVPRSLPPSSALAAAALR